MQNHSRKRAAVFGLASAAWIGVLFFFSGQSGEASGALSGKLTQFLFGWWIDRGADALQLEHVLRKLAHAGIFAVAGFLLAMTLTALFPRRAALVATFLTCAALAVTNELHELLAVARTCSPVDMLIDSAGALAGLLCAAAVLHVFSFAGRRKNPNEPYDR